jgi:hypothetical protein
MLEPTPGEPNTLIGGARKGLVERVKDILLTPKTEWNVIDAEPSTVASIFTSYVLILAAIGPICMVIGQQVFGYGLMGISIKPPIAYSIGQAVISYVMSLVSVYVSALIIDALAPSFGGTKNQVKAFKVAAYSATAVWLAGIFQIIPMLAFLAIVGLYSLYLLFLGLPRLMRVSEDKAVGYTIVVIVVQLVLFFVVGMIVAVLVASFFGSMLMGAMGGVTIR